MVSAFSDPHLTDFLEGEFLDEQVRDHLIMELSLNLLVSYR